MSTATITTSDAPTALYTVSRALTECVGGFFRRQGHTVRLRRGRAVLGYLVPSVSSPGTWCYATSGDKILTNSHGDRNTALAALVSLLS